MDGTTIGGLGVISDRVYLEAEGSHSVYLDASADNASYTVDRKQPATSIAPELFIVPSMLTVSLISDLSESFIFIFLSPNI